MYKRIKYTISEMFKRYFSDKISESSAELAYYLIFSIFPLLMFLNSVIALINIPPDSINIFLGFLPQELQTLIQEYLIYLSNSNNISPLIFGVVFTIYFFSKAINALIHTIYKIYDLPEEPSWIRKRISSIVFTLWFMFNIILNFILLILGKQLIYFISRYIDISDIAIRLWDISRYLISGGFVFLFLISLYCIVPKRKNFIRTSIIGSVFSLITWALISLIFSYYVDNMANYSILYGSLGAMMVMILWFYLTGVILTMGAQLNFIFEDSKKVLTQENSKKSSSIN